MRRFFSSKLQIIVSIGGYIKKESFNLITPNRISPIYPIRIHNEKRVGSIQICPA